MKRCLAMAIAIILFVSIVSRDHGRAEAIFFNVGQGDAYAFRTPAGKVILIDGGPDLSLLAQFDKWMGYGNRRLDYLILSHDHADHSSSLPEIVSRYDVSNALLPAQVDSDESKSLLAALRDEGSEIYFPDTTKCVQLEEDCVLCVSPPSDIFEKSKDLNETSLAVYFSCTGLAVVGAGDASKAREIEIAAVTNWHADIFKASHHGSATSNRRALIKELDPKIMVVSVGQNNTYGHPSEEVIAENKAAGIEVWRTDENGSLLIYAKDSLIFRKSWP